MKPAVFCFFWFCLKILFFNLFFMFLAVSLFLITIKKLCFFSKKYLVEWERRCIFVSTKANKTLTKKNKIMVTLCTVALLQGRAKDKAAVLLICVAIDALIIISCLQF